MNRLMILLTTLFLLISSNVFARGYINNPDRYPSIGISLGRDILGGDLRTITPPATVTQDSELEMTDVTVDLRFPISHQITLFGNLSYFSQDLSVEQKGVFKGEEHRFDGFGFRIGARYYFNK